jgi:RNase P subunit RPR2
MRTQYLHLCAYYCDKCNGPVVAGSLAIRENEISKETDIREVGAICLSCGHRQQKVAEKGFVRHFPPTQWESLKSTSSSHLATAYADALEHAEVH